MRTDTFLRRVLPGISVFLCLAASAFSWQPIWQRITWPVGPVKMQLQLGGQPIPGILQDGSASWQDSAITAMKRWNAEMKVSSFTWVTDSTAPLNSSRSYGNGYNNVLWSDTVYGDNWDIDGEGVLGITLVFSNLYEIYETDVLINASASGSWNSYQGALHNSWDGKPVWDFQRVIMHEFGHVLGLDHPDRYEAAAPALMNKAISNLYDLTADDIAGVRALYSAVRPPEILDGGLRCNTTFAGEYLSLFLMSLSGTPPYTFAWTKDGKDIGNEPTLLIPSLSVADSGEYAVKVSNSAGSITSIMTVQALEKPIPPTVTQQPRAQTVAVGSAVSLSVAAKGSAPLTYQWLRKPKGRRQWQSLQDSEAWDGTKGPSLRLIKVTAAMNGDQFRCVVINGAAPSAASDAAILNVTQP